MLRHSALVGLVVFALASPAARAIPSFARREGVSCATCHTMVPRLNRTGYDYRNAGYRMPDQLGVTDAKFKEFGDFNAARSEIVLQWLHSDPGDGTASTNQTGVNVVGASLYPVTGAIAKNFASRVELDVSPDGAVSVANMFVRGTYGSENSHANLRIGITHPWEGFGASDLPAGLSLPLFMTMPATDPATGSLYFAPQSFNQAQVELGYTWQGFNIAASMLNGIAVQGSGGNYNAVANIGGSLVRDQSDPNLNAKDFQVVANQFIEENSAISVYYYHGTLSLPVPSATTPATWSNTFDRVALFGTYAALKKVWLMGGLEYGWDHGYDATAQGPSANRFLSSGWFTEVDARYDESIGGLVRYDWFNPTRSAGNDNVQGVTVALNGLIYSGLQGILEYQLLRTDTGPNVTRTDQSLQLHLFYAF
jgi:hypothetical protein